MEEIHAGLHSTVSNANEGSLQHPTRTSLQHAPVYQSSMQYIHNNAVTTISQHKLGFTRDIHTHKKYTATTRSWLKLRVKLFIIHQTYEQKKQAGKVTHAGRRDWQAALKEQTGRQFGSQEGAENAAGVMADNLL